MAKINITNYLGRRVRVAGRNFNVRGFLSCDTADVELTYRVRTPNASVNFCEGCIDSIESSPADNESIVVLLKF